MSLIIGGGGSDGYRSASYGRRGYGGIPGLALLVVVVFFLFGAMRNGFH